MVGGEKRTSSRSSDEAKNAGLAFATQLVHSSFLSLSRHRLGVPFNLLLHPLFLLILLDLHHNNALRRPSPHSTLPLSLAKLENDTSMGFLDRKEKAAYSEDSEVVTVGQAEAQHASEADGVFGAGEDGAPSESPSSCLRPSKRVFGSVDLTGRCRKGFRTGRVPVGVVWR